MTVREQTQETEARLLAPWAAKSAETKGRKVQEAECELRTPYQRDRDRVIHCKSFRRLKHKTQVFLSPEGDHYRTRLTHTLEVSQIARTIARALGLNEDLTEAIALAHDLGHTPFGHAGERALDPLVPGGFHHYQQSVRVVDKLEKEGKGLNLCWEVLDGIRCHTSGPQAATAEGRVVRFADKIAYINHDIDDAIRAGVMEESGIPREIIQVLGATKTRRITALILSVVHNSREGEIAMDDQTKIAFGQLKEFMFRAVYLNEYAKREERKVPHMIESLFSHYLDLSLLPPSLQQVALEEGAQVAACDYVAGMTDHFAVDCYKTLFIPQSWYLD